MSQLQTLIDQRATAWDKMKGYNDAAEKDGWTADLRTAYDAAEADYDRLDADVSRAERHATREVENSHVDRRGVVAPAGTGTGEPKDTTYDTAFASYLKGGVGRMAAEERTVLEAGLSTSIQNALSVGTNTAGGYLVPPGYRQEFIIQMKDFGAVREVSQVITTESGQPLQWPTMNDTTNVGRILAENTQMTETDVVVGTATLGAYVYSSDLTRVSMQLAQDSAFDVEAMIRRAHAERIGRITNQHFTTGTGTNQPQGIVTGATSGVTAASGTAITADELIDLQHSVDPAYRNERSRYMLNDATLKAIRKLKDSSGQYLFQPGGRDSTVAGGIPALIAGAPFVINQDMAAPAVGVKSVLYGDFEAGYVIREVTDLQVITFTERYMDFLQVGHSSFLRTDGRVQNTSAYKALTQAAV